MPQRFFTSPIPSSPNGLPEAWASSRSRPGLGLLCPMVGNTYAGSSMLGLTAILDKAKPGDRVLLVSFGSGAGSDAISLRGDGRD